jgi:predicted ATPase
MKVRVIKRFEDPKYYSEEGIYLKYDNWDDFGYNTSYELFYLNEVMQFFEVGYVKVAFFGQEKNVISLEVGYNSQGLQNDYYSLGQNVEYYENLNKLGPSIRDKILNTLGDIAKSKALYNKAILEEVTVVSLMRDISPVTVTNQYRRLSNGGIRLIDYHFKFDANPMLAGSASFNLTFDVVPEVIPPTNIHVLIGRNGVGKTHLFRTMINSLLESIDGQHGEFTFERKKETDDSFANLIFISFSAFDNIEPIGEISADSEIVQYSYIGLKDLVQKGGKEFVVTKSNESMRDDFFKSLEACRASKRSAWIASITTLESDPNFKDANIKELIDITDDRLLKESASNKFDRLSSGHKIVLLSITMLIQRLQEKSLVLIDEPEAHLHPPLLSAFIRTLSELLTKTNGVAIMATHSPVILQEVPKSCVWKLRRIGAEANSSRPSMETFGENVGVLTNEVFGLEVMNSGFYTLIDKVAREKDSYEEVLKHFNGQLGAEARAILRTYFN